MAGVIQDKWKTNVTYGFTATPVTGVNKLVSQFTEISNDTDIIQDSFSSDVPDAIQDVFK